ncbi:MAG: SH3 domain-containing protein [Planctomycetes bacterium]|nr:SH3 domain-containing protein [Planctomycetota bacterium]
MTRVVALAVVALMSAGAAASGADRLSRRQQADLLDEALASFGRGTALAGRSPDEAMNAFRQSADTFEALVDGGLCNGRLYYNLGNARLKCGQLGRAIAAYRRAEEFMPTDARLQENLRYARSLRRDEIAERGPRTVARTLFFWHYDTPLDWRFAIGLGAWALFWLALLGRTLVGRFRWGSGAVALLMVWLTLAVSVTVDWKVARGQRAGVITANEVMVRKGNGLGYAPQFEQTLGEGVEFEVLEERDAWLHVRLPDGQEGWIAATDAERI